MKFNKQVVFMDEPSTGLDPASRNNLWNVMKEAKKNRAIILTSNAPFFTHASNTLDSITYCF
jgi:ABC-type multidrug transport system ATPase subunit